MTITRTQRAQVKKIVAASNSYDASTMRISADGIVSAKHDADKTFAGSNPTRFLVGDVAEIIARGSV